MIRKHNKGVTLVEVMIALAIFLILMLPLVSSLITSVKTTDSGKELQSRNDFAEVLMENFKNAPVDDLKSSNTTTRNAAASQLFDGSENVVATPTQAKDSSGNVIPGEYDITITGNTYLGTKKTKYSYKIEADYDQETTSHGIMDDLDPYKSAFVPVTLSNYDDVASEAIVTQKLEGKSNGTGGTVFSKKDDVNSLRNIQADREVNVKMTGSKSAGFEVTCTITYTDSGKSITYEPYKQTFKNGVPNIYLMYNAGVYNDMSTKDSIKFDLSAVNFAGFGDKERVNAFIIRTSEDYTDIIKDFENSDGTYNNTRFGEMTDLLSDKLKDAIITSKNELESAGSSSTILYKQSSSGNRNNSVTIKGGSNVSKDRFRVYHNLFYFDASNVKQNLAVAESNIAANVDSIDNAREEVWKIYKVKIWVQEGDSVNSSSEMVTLQGTRGGGEIE